MGRAAVALTVRKRPGNRSLRMTGLPSARGAAPWAHRCDAVRVSAAVRGRMLSRPRLLSGGRSLPGGPPDGSDDAARPAPS